jgi:hypothetical protein
MFDGAGYKRSLKIRRCGSAPRDRPPHRHGATRVRDGAVVRRRKAC